MVATLRNHWQIPGLLPPFKRLAGDCVFSWIKVLYNSASECLSMDEQFCTKSRRLMNLTTGIYAISRCLVPRFIGGLNYESNEGLGKNGHLWTGTNEHGEKRRIQLQFSHGLFLKFIFSNNSEKYFDQNHFFTKTPSVNNLFHQFLSIYCFFNPIPNSLHETFSICMHLFQVMDYAEQVPLDIHFL